MVKAMNIVDNTYNNWKVVSRANSKRGHTYWNTKCQTCGKEKISEGCHFTRIYRIIFVYGKGKDTFDS